jgi:hypothetical protein
VASALCIIINLFSACTRPAKNRWLSTATCLSIINAGFMVHNFLPRLWRLAFGEPTIPRGVRDQSDWHTYVRSKISRSSYWMSLDDTRLGTSIFCAICAPADHLLAVLQRFDAHGAGLRDLICPGSSPVDACIATYFGIVTDPLRNMKCLVDHFFSQGFVFLSAMMAVCFATALALASRIWRDIREPGATWPFKLVGLTMFESMVQETAEQLFAAAECCLDKHFTLKLRQLAGSLEALLGDPELLGASPHLVVGHFMESSGPWRLGAWMHQDFFVKSMCPWKAELAFFQIWGSFPHPSIPNNQLPFYI